MSRGGGRVYDFTWSRRNLLALIVLCLLSTGLVAFRRLCRPAELAERITVDPRRVEDAAESIDPNTARAASMRRLPGIGPIIAERIVAYRRGHADEPFRSPGDLARVNGIGPRTVHRISPYLKFKNEK